jgi:hypothetical protein
MVATEETGETIVAAEETGKEHIASSEQKRDAVGDWTFCFNSLTMS